VPGGVLLAVEGVLPGVLPGLLPGCELLGMVPLFGLVPLFGFVPLLGVAPLGGAVGVVLGVVGVPGASGGLTPGGDELDGGAVAGDLLVEGAPLEGDGACEDGADADEDAPPAGAAGADWACAPVAATKPSAAAATTVCNLSMLFPL
jgi:hypothetical protein